jgi:hypothetical protein
MSPAYVALLGRRWRNPIRVLSPSAILRLLLGLLAFAAPLSGQQQDPKLTITRSHRIVQLTEDIRVDGRLDEPAWSKVEAITGFVQADPKEGEPISERTEAYIFYDERRIYFGFKCYESEPKKIIGRLDTHDARTNSDSVNIFLDPYGDRRTGYFFSINARGVQFDGLVSEASGMDGTWDGIWESAARIEDWGWSAEVAIPFKSIRLTPGQTWGMNLSRDIVRKNESAYWQFLARFESFPPRPSKAGLLEGIEQVERGRNLEVIPYFSTRARRGAVSPLDNGQQYEGGVDVRWGLLPNATLNITVNPDFAETESDEANITISRFELFFPEKRAFFNEGSTFFSTPLNLFFTRRVGARLPDGQPQRILLGAKLTGKVQGWSLGLLEARTEETRFRDPATGARMVSPGANFFVLRGQRDIFRSSSIGFLTVNRDQQDGDVGSTQRIHAVDLNIIGGPYFKWRTQAAYNQNDSSTRSGIQRVAFESEASHNSDNWEIEGRYKYLGRGVDVSEIGFEPETDRHSAAASVKWQPFIDRAGIRQIFFEVNQDISIDTEGLTQDSGSDVDISARFQNFWSARVRYSYDLVRFNEFTTTPNCPPPFGCSPAFGRLDPTRAYITPRLRFFLNSNENRAWYFNYEFLWRKVAQFRENFYGREQNHFLSVTGRLFGRTRVQFNGRWIRELLEDGTPFQMRRQFLARVQHQFTRKLRVRTLAQVTNDRLGQNFSMNSIVAYDFTARSAAIVGYNYQKGAPGRPGDLGNEFFAKFSYLFQF